MQARKAEAMRKGMTKQAILKSDSHAYGSESFLWPTRLACWRHQQLPKLAPSRFKPTMKVCEHNRAVHSSCATLKQHSATWTVYLNSNLRLKKLCSTLANSWDANLWSFAKPLRETLFLSREWVKDLIFRYVLPKLGTQPNLLNFNLG